MRIILVGHIANGDQLARTLPSRQIGESNMSLEGKTAEEIQALEAELLARLETHPDGYCGNITLQRELNWDPEAIYWDIRDRLIDQGRLFRKRARGGAVGIITREAGNPAVAAEAVDAAALAPAIGDGPPAPAPAPAAPRREIDLYEPVAAVLQGRWARDERFRHSLTQITALQGRRSTGGTWTRPDIVVVALRIFPYLPGKFCDVITFEIKPSSAIDVTAVYEALAHRRAATQSYAFFHCPLEQEDVESDNLDRIQEECERHGIGMIVARDPSDYETWIERAEAERVVAEPSRVNELIAVQFPEGAKDEIAAWMR